MAMHGATVSGGPAGTPASFGEEHTSIGNDPLAGWTTDHDVGSLAAPEEDGEQRGGGGTPGRLWQSARGPGPGVVGVEALEGRTVESAEGEELGRVAGVTVDLACGRLAYVVIELTAFAGGELCAVPWPAFRVDARTGKLSLAFSPDDLHQAPTFAADRWPDMTDERWAEVVHGFFRSRPYWV